MTIYKIRTDMPEMLSKVYVDFYWSKKKLWEGNFSEKDYLVAELDWILSYPIWYKDAYPVPNNLIQNPNLDPDHWDRVLKADLAFPVHIIFWKQRWLILDGIHRLIKTKLEGRKMIKTKMLLEKDIKDILPDQEDFNSGFLFQSFIFELRY